MTSKNVEVSKTSTVEINECNARSIQAFKDAYKEKGLQPDPEIDLPYDQRIQLERLEAFKARVDESKGIERKLVTLIRQPVNIVGKDGKRVTRMYCTDMD